MTRDVCKIKLFCATEIFFRRGKKSSELPKLVSHNDKFQYLTSASGGSNVLTDVILM